MILQINPGAGGIPQVSIVPSNNNNNNANFQAGDDGENCSGNCDCWERGKDYVGGDLSLRQNPVLVEGAEECQQRCQNTPGCQNWAWERKRAGGSLRNNFRRRQTQCWLKGSSFSKRSVKNRISGPRACIDIQVTNPQPSSGCVTTGGGRTGANCVFPFTYKVRTERCLDNVKRHTQRNLNYFRM